MNANHQTAEISSTMNEPMTIGASVAKSLHSAKTSAILVARCYGCLSGETR